jgi:hypothetical protein
LLWVGAQVDDQSAIKEKIGFASYVETELPVTVLVWNEGRRKLGTC